MISDGLKLMTGASQAEWMGLIELCACVCGTVLQMAAVSMVAIKREEVSGQG